MAVLLAAALMMGLVGAPKAQGQAMGSPVEETDATAYNITFLLAGQGPATMLFAAQKGGSGYLVSFHPGATVLSRCDGAKVTRLASAPVGCLGVRPVLVTVKVRAGVLLVERERRPLLQAFDDRYAAGSIRFPTLPPTAAVRDLRVQQVGDVAFEDEFLPDSPVLQEWAPVRGQWRIESYRDPMMGEDQGPVGASWYAVRGTGRCVSVGGRDYWDDLAVEVSARVPKGHTAGLVFHFRDRNNYGLFRVQAGHPGAIALEEVVAGTPRRVAQVPWNGDLSWWRRLRVETHGPVVRGLLDGVPVVSGVLSWHTDGRIGLYAHGGTAAEFDDLSVLPFQMLRAGFERPRMTGWQTAGGAWQASAGFGSPALKHAPTIALAPSGTASWWVRPASPALALARGQKWSDLDASLVVNVPQEGEAGLAFRAAGPDTGYALVLRREKGGRAQWLLRCSQGRRRIVLAAAPAATGEGWHRLTVRAVGGRIQSTVDGAALPLAYDFTFGAGRVGLYADGAGQCGFARLDVAGPPAASGATLFETDLRVRAVRGLNQEETLRVVGDILRPAAPAWEHDERAGFLQSRAAGALWYHEPWGWDTVVRCAVSGNGAGLLLCGDGRSPDSGYRLSLEGSKAAFYRRGKPVARLALAEAPAEGWLPLELRRDGGFVVFRAGKERRAFRDPQPLSGAHAGLWAGAAGARFDDLNIALAHAVASPFDRVDTDWRPVSGKWLLHSGMTCVPWTYWIGADGRDEPALMWSRHRLPRDFEVSFRVAEHSLGDEAGEHRHFPYHDLRLVLCGSPADPLRGYTVLLGAEGGKGNHLLREGKVLSQTSAFRIVMGGHCNTPRQVYVRARKTGGRLQVWANGSPVFDVQDPSPPAGGQVALGLARCEANFRDFLACW